MAGSRDIGLRCFERSFEVGDASSCPSPCHSRRGPGPNFVASMLSEVFVPLVPILQRRRGWMVVVRRAVVFAVEFWCGVDARFVGIARFRG